MATALNIYQKRGNTSVKRLIGNANIVPFKITPKPLNAAGVTAQKQYNPI